jgi:hypothetical protein
MQDSNGNDAVFTMVWGTDINVTDIQNQFTQFVKGFRQQTGIDEEGVPVLEAEAKYMAYLTDVCCCRCCTWQGAHACRHLDEAVAVHTAPTSWFGLAVCLAARGYPPLLVP